MALLLTAIAGYVDAAGYLSFAHIYTANMSGNSVAIGIGLGQTNWPQAAERLWPVTLYVAGILCGRTLIEVAGRLRAHRVASLGFLLEAALLAGSIAAAPGQSVCVALLASAMGLQNALLTRFSDLTVHSGFVTGSLLNMAEQAVRYGAWLWDRYRESQLPLMKVLAESPHEKCFQTACALLCVWFAYVVGATCGTLATLRFAVSALLGVMPAFLGFIAVDLRHPLAVEEERAQLGQE